MKRVFVTISLILTLIMTLLASCGNNNIVDNGINGQPSEESTVFFSDIVNLMSMSKDEVFDWWGKNYKKVPSGWGEKIEKYQDRNKRFSIYFLDLVNTEKIDSIDFESAVDINGIRIGMAYEEITNKLPENYFMKEMEKNTGEWYQIIQCTYNDFFVFIEIKMGGSEKVDNIRIVRSIPIESIKPLLAMDGNELVDNYGGEYKNGAQYAYKTENDNYYYNDYMGVLLSFENGFSDGRPYNSISTAEYQYNRINFSGMWIGTDEKDILDILGEPYYHGPVIYGDDTHPVGDLLVYEVGCGQICFYANEPDEPWDRIEYLDWANDNFIKSDAKVNEEIFKYSDCEIEGIKLGWTENKIIEIKDLPQSTYNDGLSKNYQCGSTEYTFQQTDENEWILIDIILRTNEVEGPRGIRVGDNYKDIIAKFYSNYSLGELSYNGNTILYSNGFLTTGFVSFNENDKINNISYIYCDQDNALTLNFDIRNGAITTIELYKCLPGMPLVDRLVNTD